MKLLKWALIVVALLWSLIWLLSVTGVISSLAMWVPPVAVMCLAAGVALP